jgi:hypothetical protein
MLRIEIGNLQVLEHPPVCNWREGVVHKSDDAASIQTSLLPVSIKKVTVWAGVPTLAVAI